MKKKFLLCICSFLFVSQIDAGWRDQWVWFKSLFSGFSIKKPIITRKQVVIGGVGALAVAGAAWWWFKRISKKSPPQKNESPKKEESIESESSSLNSHQNQKQSHDIRTNIKINDPAETSIVRQEVDTDNSKVNNPLLREEVILQSTEPKKIIIAPSVKVAKDQSVHEGVVKEIGDPESKKIMDISETEVIKPIEIVAQIDELPLVAKDVDLKEKSLLGQDLLAIELKKDTAVVDSLVQQKEIISSEKKTQKKVKETEEEAKAAEKYQQMNQAVDTKKAIGNFQKLIDKYEKQKELTDFDISELKKKFEKLDSIIPKGEMLLWKSIKARYNELISTKK